MNSTFIVQQARQRGQASREQHDGSSAFILSQSRSRYSMQSRSSRSSDSSNSASTSAQPSTWYDDRKIRETVTEEFLHKSIGDEKLRAKLSLPIMDGLTDTTFGEWILWKAQKLFVLFLELGEISKIFDLVEGSWDDSDLPVDEINLGKLNLKDANLERRFYKRQFAFLVREIAPGSHMTYAPEETVPIEPIVKHALKSVGTSTLEKFVFPRTQEVVIRKSIALVDSLSNEDLIREVEDLRVIAHPHIVSLFASYSHMDEGCLLFSPATELTLKAFFQTSPALYKSLSQEGKRRQMFDWMHCLADALSFLAEKGIVHKELRPKTILIEGTTIFLADIGSSKRMELHETKTSLIDKPNYEYAAPEIYRRNLQRSNTAKVVTFSGRSIIRRPSTDSSAICISPSSDHGVNVMDWVQSTEEETRRCDMFSLACIYLEILTFLQGKRTLKAFVTHRGAKNRRGGRGARAAIADSSYHANLEQVASWIQLLNKDAEKREDRSSVTATKLCSEMLFKHPSQRPEAWEVRDRLYNLAEVECRPNHPHCSDMQTRQMEERIMSGGWSRDFSLDEMMITPTASEFASSPANDFAWFHHDSMASTAISRP